MFSRFKCEVTDCQYPGATSKARLDQHMVAAHGAEPTHCQYCGKTISYDNVKKHLKACKEYRAKQQEKLIHCHIEGCDFTFATGDLKLSAVEVSRGLGPYFSESISLQVLVWRGTCKSTTCWREGSCKRASSAYTATSSSVGHTHSKPTCRNTEVRLLARTSPLQPHRSWAVSCVSDKISRGTYAPGIKLAGAQLSSSRFSF